LPRSLSPASVVALWPPFLPWPDFIR
jgi:hypothetical protein